MLEGKALVEATLSSAYHWTSFLAASTQHSGDWLFALPIASYGLTLDDEAVRVAVGLRLGLTFASHSYVSAVLQWTPVGSIVLSVREPRAGQQGTMLSTTWSLNLLPQLECPSQKSLPGCPEQTGNDRMALHSSLGRAGSRFVGMLQ